MKEITMQNFDADDMELESIVCGKKFTVAEPDMGCNEPVKHRPAHNIVGMVRDGFVYSALSAILIWWKNTGRLDETAAWYALVVCIGMVFFAVGKNWGVKK